MLPKPIFDITDKSIWIAGESGMVGRAMLRRLKNENCNIISAPHSALDLLDRAATLSWMKDHKPDVVIMAAAKVGGIGANMAEPEAFYDENLKLAQNVIDGAFEAGTQKLIYLGSSCIYPKDAPQPMSEEVFLSGALEPTNEAYAKAKIEGIQLCQKYKEQYYCDYVAVMPTNLYGSHDTYDVDKSHVIPAMILKIHQAKENNEDVMLWGSGTPLREFLFVDDCADAITHALQYYSDKEIINIGSGEEISIYDLAHNIANVIDFEGKIIFDPSKPDGVQRKLLDCSKINNLGWSAKTTLDKGLVQAYQWFLDNKAA